MPIKSIADQYEFGSGLPCIGRLRKGDKKTDPKRPGKDLTYFRFTPEPGYERYFSVFQTLYGEQPTVFSPVRFGGSTVEDVFDYWNRGYTATKLMHKCDGDIQARHFDVETGAYSAAPIACEAPGCGCKNTGRIKLFLPKLIDEIGVFGYVLLTTTSLYDIRNLLNCFRDIERLIALHGRDLSDVDFLIGRAPRVISVPVPEPKTPSEREAYRRNHHGQDWKRGDRINTTKNLLYIRPNEEYTKRVLLGVVVGDAFVAKERPALPPLVPVRTSSLGVVPKVAPKPQERRLSAASASMPEAPDFDDEDDDSAPDWLDAFLKWVKETFEGFSGEKINAALELADGWQEDKNVAKAAIIAAKLNYQLTLIDVYTSSNQYSIEVYDAAKRIVEAYQQRSQAVALEGEVVE